MIGVEHRYNPMEKECFALVFAIQEMRHYLVGQTIHVISKVNPLRVLMTKPSSLNCHLVKWAILLSQYSIHFMPQKAVKGQALTDLLADHPVPDSSRLYEDLPDEVVEAYVTQGVMQVWKLFFDSESRASPDGGIIASVGVVLVSATSQVIPRGFSLFKPYTINVTEYNALLLGMQQAEELNIQYLEAYCDSQLIVNEVQGEYEVYNEDLVLYHFAALKLA
ncbi:uncharacterized protein LOC109847638 [Asparagus officinalis]|uniref:uncharacterized protein LOC109847638 n=1 Tax=Asparagus officinalis TaxID=4686 RepID=UPI00098DF56B|nr:uncharacterized protein LOC109847638 [Asparagus officinalis]